MFISVLLTVGRKQKHPLCSSKDEWILKMWCIYTMMMEDINCFPHIYLLFICLGFFHISSDPLSIFFIYTICKYFLQIYKLPLPSFHYLLYRSSQFNQILLFSLTKQRTRCSFSVKFPFTHNSLLAGSLYYMHYLV